MLMNTKKTLICFTASYPYGLKETFFDNELPYLAKGFEKVVVIPRYNPSGSAKIRTVPENVVVHQPLVSSNKLTRTLHGLLNSSPFRFHVKDFFKHKVYRSKHALISWFNSLLVFRKSFSVLKRQLETYDQKDTVLYSYWADAPFFLTDIFEPYKKVVRMHRGDYYVEENNGYLPLRQEIYDKTDLLIPISDHIFYDLINSYGIDKRKIQLHRLGISNHVTNHANTNPVPPNDIIRLVSCSRVDPVKRVSLIVDALMQYDGNEQVEWHHFGDGLEFEQLKEQVKVLDNNRITVLLHGWASQSDIYQFYRTNYVNWLINVSESEGIPVSIMEAMSFGIPVIATDVGGSSEIVNERTGILLDKSFDIYKLLNGILSCNQEVYLDKRHAAKQIWAQQYQAETNYEKLSLALQVLVKYPSGL